MDKSIKGKWTDADRATFLEEFRTELEKAAKIDKNLKRFNVTDAQLDALSACNLAKIEAAYTPEESGYEENQSIIEQFSLECTMNILIGKKGAWSVIYKEIMKMEMTKKLEDSLTAEQKSSLVDCTISKAEQEFAPSDLANSNEAMIEISKNCREEIIGR